MPPGSSRDVLLEAVPPVSLVRAEVRAEPVDKGAKVRTAVVLRNAGSANFSGQLELRVFPTRVTEANLTALRADAIMRLQQPVEVTEGATKRAFPWPATPSMPGPKPSPPSRSPSGVRKIPGLYVLEVTLRAETGEVVDRLTTQFGVRSLAVDPKQPRLLLNGKPLLLAGVNWVEDDPQLGRTGPTATG